MPLKLILVEVDKYSEEVLDEKIPYIALMMNGDTSAVYGYGSPDERP